MAFAPFVVLLVRLAGSGAAARYVLKDPGEPTPLQVGEYYMGRLRDRSVSDEELSVALSDLNSYSVVVATYTDPFELRRMQVMFTQADAVVSSDDVRVLTIDLLKVAAGVPQTEWVADDFTQAKGAFNTFWTAIKGNFSTTVKFDRIKFYKLGPDIFPPQTPVHEADYDVAGTSASATMPPQVAISVTEKAGSKQHWGRFYLPAPAQAVGNTYGRITTAYQTVIADAADAMYESFKSSNIPAVVYRRELAVRTRKDGVELPFRSATAWTVDALQVDDVFDVIRSRRWKYPQLRVQRDIA